MKIGYARVSTQEQNLTAQLEALKEAGCTKIYHEKASTRPRPVQIDLSQPLWKQSRPCAQCGKPVVPGSAREGRKRLCSECSGAKPEATQPELERLLDAIRQGDVLVVTKLDRLARSTTALLGIAERIQEAGASFVSLAEPWADTTNHAGKLIMTVFAGIAEFERERIRERCGEGRKAARKAGVKFGRPPALTTEQRGAVVKLRHSGKSVLELARTFQVSSETIRRVLVNGDGQ